MAFSVSACLGHRLGGTWQGNGEVIALLFPTFLAFGFPTLEGPSWDTGPLQCGAPPIDCVSLASQACGTWTDVTYVF